MIVVDASLFVAWLLNEPAHAPASTIFDMLATETIAVPAHWPIEVASALRKAVQNNRLAHEEVAPILDRLGLLDFSVANPISNNRISHLVDFATTYRLSVYDAAYVQLALAHRVGLATLDNQMRNAAKELNVAVLPE